MSMLASSTTDIPAARFEPYIEELREFFTSRGLPFGAPSDLPPFLEHLADPGFHEEMVSMVRSILYRVETVPRAELAELLAIASGGAQVLSHAQEVRRPLREIEAFVNEVTGAKPGSAFLDPAPERPDVAPESLHETHSTLDVYTQPSASLAVDGATNLPSPAANTTNGHLSQSLLRLQNSSEEPFVIAAEEPTPPLRPILTAPVTAVGQQTKPTLAALLRRSYWIPGVIALLLAIAAGTLLKSRSTVPPGASTSQGPVQIAPGQPRIENRGNSAARQARAVRPAPYQAAVATGPGLLPPPAARSLHPPQQTRPGLATGDWSPRRRSPSAELPAASRSSFNALLGPREGVFLASSGAMASHLLSAPAPGYPKLASLTRTEGEVVVQVVVGRGGKVTATRVLDGPHLLRGAAERAIHKWRYRPYLVDGHPTDVATIVTVSFRLH